MQLAQRGQQLGRMVPAFLRRAVGHPDQLPERVRADGDAGKSGLTSEGRPAFTEMMDEWVKKRTDFSYILCLDVSRWGRFQDIDLSAQFNAECRKNNKQVIYTTFGKPREDDPL